MKKLNKKTVAIVIVVAIVALVAVLGVVLLPKLKESGAKQSATKLLENDQYTVKQFNAVLSNLQSEGITYVSEAINAVKAGGFDVSKPKTQGISYGFDITNKEFALVNVNEGKVAFSEKAIADTRSCYVLTDNESEANKLAGFGFSLYLTGGIDKLEADNFVSIDTNDFAIKSLKLNKEIECSIMLIGSFDSVEITNSLGAVVQDAKVGTLTLNAINNEEGYLVNGIVDKAIPAGGKLVVGTPGFIDVIDILQLAENMGAIIENKGHIDKIMEDDRAVDSSRLSKLTEESVITGVEVVPVAPDKNVATFAQLKKALKDGGFYKLTDDIVVSNKDGVARTNELCKPIAKVTKKVFLDLDGHSITIERIASLVDEKSAGVICVGTTGDLTIIDSSDEQTGIISGPSRSGGASIFYSAGKFALISGTIEITDDSTSPANKENLAAIRSSGVVTVNGGKINCKKIEKEGSEQSGAWCIFPTNGSVTINGGSFNTEGCTSIIHSWAYFGDIDITINNGEFNAGGAVDIGLDVNGQYKQTVIINGGSFKKGIYNWGYPYAYCRIAYGVFCPVANEQYQ